MSTNINKKTVNSVLDSQRKESEVRSLLQDLEKLISLKGESKLRWVWELIQNAKDCANGNRVNIFFTLTKDKLIFEHDGEPFQIEHLIALVRKTSTKSIEGLDGNTGKFGTGFVTTHVLNTKVTIRGLLQNEEGCRAFSLFIDRSFDTLPTLTESLEKAYEEIDIINEMPPTNDIEGVRTMYEYDLEDYKFNIAKEGLEKLVRNLSFTLLINNEHISSVTITDEEGKRVSFAIDNPQTAFADIGFSKIIREDISHSQCEIGLLFKQTPELTIAFPVTKNSDNYSLHKIEDQARVFRDFPLIGTENFHFPCLVHSTLFQPTDSRDGIRTLKDREDSPDKHADENREAIKLYVSLFQSIFSQFVENKIGNLHLLAESGLPDDTLNYLANSWFETEIQQPLRDFLLQHNLVKNVDGALIKIENAKFINTYDFEIESEFYAIASELFPSYCPDEDSYKDWKAIIEQNPEKWVTGIFINVEDVVEEVGKKNNLDELKIPNGNTILWLNKLIDYILKIGKIKLTEQHAIYPNQSRNFKRRLELKLDPGFSNEIKNISKNIYRNLYDEFILDEIQNQDDIQKFEIVEFFSGINTFIGGLDCNKASQEQVSAIFELGCYFKEANAPKRNEWFELTNTLIPTLSEKKFSTNILEEFNFDPTDKWTLKYVSLLIEEAVNFVTFSKKYFSDDIPKAIDWMNRFIAFACRNDENKDAAFKYAIVLTQDGKFKKYDNLIRESNHEDFEPIFKDMVKDYVGKGDPREYLIDQRITNDYFTEKGADFLTEQIDKLFSDSKSDDEVEEGERLNSLFHKLNDWFVNDEGKEKDKQKTESLFPIFTEKRPKLSVRAYGKEMSKIVIIKGIDEIKALAKLKRDSKELSQLEQAADLAGDTQTLLRIAQELHDNAERIEWRKKVGAAAEQAFLDAIQNIDTKFDIENPDCGKDFTVTSKTTNKEFYIEIKSTIIGEETVKMSSLQGQTAKDEKHRYALCVITRPSGTLIDKEYFLQHVKFVPTIGELLGDKLSNILNDLKNISEHESDDDVNVTMDNKSYSIYVKKKIWDGGISFPDFVVLLQNYLMTPEKTD